MPIINGSSLKATCSPLGSEKSSHIMTFIKRCSGVGRGRGEGVGGEETACWRPINLEAMRGQEKGEMVGKRRGEGEREKR